MNKVTHCNSSDDGFTVGDTVKFTSIYGKKVRGKITIIYKVVNVNKEVSYSANISDKKGNWYLHKTKSIKKSVKM